MRRHRPNPTICQLLPITPTICRRRQNASTNATIYATAGKPSQNTSGTEGVSRKPDVRVAIITCAVLEIEMQHFAKLNPNVIYIEIIEQGLHNEPDKLRIKLQEA